MEEKPYLIHAVTLMGIFSLTVCYNVYSYIPVYIKSTHPHINSKLLSLVMCISEIGACFGSYSTNYLIDRFNTKQMMALGFLIQLLGILLQFIGSFCAYDYYFLFF